jgi:hypothetical protein
VREVNPCRAVTISLDRWNARRASRRAAAWAYSAAAGLVRVGIGYEKSYYDICRNMIITFREIGMRRDMVRPKRNRTALRVLFGIIVAVAAALAIAGSGSAGAQAAPANQGESQLCAVRLVRAKR